MKQSLIISTNHKLFRRLGAIHLLRKKNSGWLVSSNAYNCLFILHRLANFGPILHIIWIGGWVQKW